MQPQKLLKWYLDSGVDAILDAKPNNRFARKEPVEAAPASSVREVRLSGTGEWEAKAREAAEKASNLKELREAVASFDGLSIKKTANKTVFSDGNPESRVMLIGEAPGANEDMEGIPFCGISGKLLDNMLLAIGIDRDKCYITNTVFWRPPGNRKPTPEELAICLPFVEKHVALVNPKVILLVGGTAVQSVLADSTSVTRLRGKTHSYSNRYTSSKIPTLVTYHPSYLLRSPTNKRLAWQDMLRLAEIISEKN